MPARKCFHDRPRGQPSPTGSGHGVLDLPRSRPPTEGAKTHRLLLYQVQETISLPTAKGFLAQAQQAQFGFKRFPVFSLPICSL